MPVGAAATLNKSDRLGCAGMILAYVVMPSSLTLNGRRIFPEHREAIIEET